MRIRGSPERYDALAAARGGFWRGDRNNYKGVNHKTFWECGKLHGPWEATPNNVQQGKWCPYCARNIKLTIVYCRKLAIECCGLCLSKEYKNAHTPLEWECAKGHIWWAAVNHIREGHWCPYCAGVAKVTIDDCDELAVERDGLCLSRDYVDYDTKLQWQCAEAHVWWATLNSVHKHWCPYCAGNAKSNIERCCELAIKQNGMCLSKKYASNHARLQWQCAEGHTWWASRAHIQQGHWCPYCFHRHSKSELVIFDYIRQIHLDARSGVGRLLKNKQFELDVYIPSLCKAIEFDGTYWHKASKYASPQRDASKNAQCLEAGIQLLRIPEADFLKDPDAVFAKIDAFLKS